MGEQARPLWQLRDLLASAGLPLPAGVAGLGVTGIETDSRLVRPGQVFVAYRGLSVDGHEFVPGALAAGAAALVLERPPSIPPPVPLVLVPDGRIAWARLCAAWEGHPSRRLRLAGVTGTDGKTTTATLLHHLLSAAGTKTGLVTTVCATVDGQTIDTGLHTTTPPPPLVQSLLAGMVRAGCGAAVLEATSEGLAQQRLQGCEFDLALVTNVTHDHLYYHGSLDAYLEAKAGLFRYLATTEPKPGVPKTAVLNRDDASFARLRVIPADVHLTYGREDADVVFAITRESRDGIVVRLSTPWGSAEASLALPGRHNAYNLAASVAAACAWGAPLDIVVAATASFSGVPGRTDFVRMGQPYNVVVDFAHTENALVQVLSTARTWTPGRLIVVFGCAGERDTAKRRPMAARAIQLADLAFLTAEDPRRERLQDILLEMEEGARAAGGEPERDYRVIPDRGEAIRAAIAEARAGDTVLICGKGHEQSMCSGVEERPWSDHHVTGQALRALGFCGSQR